MANAIFSEDFKTTPLWWEAARPEAAKHSSLPAETDVAIGGPVCRQLLERACFGPSDVEVLNVHLDRFRRCLL